MSPSSIEISSIRVMPFMPVCVWRIPKWMKWNWSVSISRNAEKRLRILALKDLLER